MIYPLNFKLLAIISEINEISLVIENSNECRTENIKHSSDNPLKKKKNLRTKNESEKGKKGITRQEKTYSTQKANLNECPDSDFPSCFLASEKNLPNEENDYLVELLRKNVKNCFG